MSRNNEIQKKSENEIVFLAEERKCTNDLIAFSRRFACISVVRYVKKTAPVGFLC